ncbi:MAG: hypothetical protein KF749_13300 [Bacteroidetes bacterium]|nr:hypothetical protein [Bacteroidota bacterium]MCW5894330.1 hypothetical protein [Bacteroidota bacterium]
MPNYPKSTGRGKNQHQDKKRGRPKTKVSSKQYLKRVFIARFDGWADEWHWWLLKDLEEAGAFTKDFWKTFSPYPSGIKSEEEWEALLEEEQSNRERLINEEHDTEDKNRKQFNNAAEHYRYEFARIKSKLPDASFEEIAQWFFIVGIKHGLQQEATKRIIPLMFEEAEHYGEDLTNASSLVKGVLRANELLKNEGLPKIELHGLPNDLLRKYRVSKFNRRTIIKFISDIKEMADLRTISNVARALGQSEQVVIELFDEAKRQRFNIKMGKGRKGERILVV